RDFSLASVSRCGTSHSRSSASVSLHPRPDRSGGLRQTVSHCARLAGFDRERCRGRTPPGCATDQEAGRAVARRRTRGDTMGTPLIEVQKFGQSIWYDNIRRGLITSGELAQMVEKDGLLGVTSTPAIFTAAITGSPDYDQPLKALVGQGGGTAIDLHQKLALNGL